MDDQALRAGRMLRRNVTRSPWAVSVKNNSGVSQVFD
jgi:hypothetical protein